MSTGIVSTPSPTTTTTDGRAAAKARTNGPSGSSQSERPRKTAPSRPRDVSTPVDKALDDAGLKGAAREAKKGINEAARAVDRQPTPERRVVTAVVKSGEAAVKTAAAAGVDIGKKAAEAVRPVVEHVTRPVVRETKEAGREIGEAGGNVATTRREAQAELQREVSEAWEKQPTIERKVVVAGYEAAENIVAGTGRLIASGANASKEVLEGAFEIGLHNPVNAAIVSGGKAAVDGAVDLGRNVGSWIGDRIDGGARGATEAGKTASEANNRIGDRSREQREENSREIGEAASEYGRGVVDTLNPFDDDEVQDAWNDQPTIERQVVVAGYEVGEALVQGAASNTANLARLGSEVLEGAGETVVTEVQNAGEAVSSGFRAAGDFFGGLFGN